MTEQWVEGYVSFWWDGKRWQAHFYTALYPIDPAPGIWKFRVKVPASLEIRETGAELGEKV